jgi:release factor glutamine methyltransferase
MPDSRRAAPPQAPATPAPDHAPTWDDLLARSGLPRLEARALLEHACGQGRSWLIAHGNETAPPQAAARYCALVARRRDGEPLAYLTGWREFHGLRLHVSPAVLIPRADTETLVDLAIRLAPPGARLLDLGTGSGAIALAIAAARPDLALTGTDLSEAALAIARENATACLTQPRPAQDGSTQRPGGPVRWLAGNWWAALPAGEPPFDLIVSNPPYIADEDPHLGLGDLRAEPRQALASGPDGLDDLKRIVAGAPQRLVPGGWLLVEHGFDQGPAVRALFEAAGLIEPATIPDAQARDRVTLGRRRTIPRV